MASFSQAVWLVLIEPVLIRLGVAPGSGDPTYGRIKIPYTPRERKYIYENPRVQVTERRVASGLIEKGTAKEAKQEDAVQKAGPALGGDTWYNVWEIPEAVQKANLNSDVVLVHGMNDYGGKLGPLAMPYLEAGFRVIVYDLPGHGRSAGLHGYAPDMRALPQALHAVMRDVMKHDGEAARGRKMFLTGTSMGGFTCLYYAALYSPIPKNKNRANGTNGLSNGTQHPAAEGGAQADDDTIPAETDDLLRPNLAGVAVTAPMITISKESTPPWILHKIAELLCFIVPRLPLVKGVKGNTSDDPRTDVEFHQDPITYKGNVRIGTGLAIWAGIEHLQQIPDQIQCPVALHHGSKDRATSAQGTKEFFPRIGSERKTLKIWDGYEHIMQKFVDGMSKEDEAKSNAVIHAMRDFFLELAKES
ncbi:unnamed protein product [Tilletia caries]|uniref:Serine aminopeptidase S33 domain-containing protein n=1 Tax=Tilletia caries TaxID=13290 RepID=A0A177UEY8_9BASI|nr:hypothetical protein CF336_g3921 [Tilletia laevis]KAE8261495.1 hypothetical protein A4X03_0g3205 [Tilletia caries]KAE8196278.1 hypothetical protein CF335_g4894 [Tilletia laevis]CAD6932294.1 unnamed protein product [Tilletia caries]CAD6954058.1 unnamed protein product [Tilletia caries]